MHRLILADGSGRSLAAEVPSNRRERLRGLLGRRDLPPGTGLLLLRATAIHTFGMRFPIEVAWLDAAFRVVEVRVVPPGRATLPRPGARHVLECPVGTGLRVGDRLVEAARVVGYTRGAAPGAVGPQGRGHAPIV